MTSEDIALLHVVRGTLNEGKVSYGLLGLNKKGILDLAREQGLLPYLAWYLSKADDTPQTERDNFNKIIKASAIREMIMDRILTSVVKRMSKCSITPLILKGYSIAKHYPNSCMRAFSDLDIQVMPWERQRAHEILIELGFASTFPKYWTISKAIQWNARSAHLHPYIKEFPGHLVTIELHQPIKSYCGYDLHFFSACSVVDVKSGDVFIHRYNDLDLFIYCCLHYAYHAWGPGRFKDLGNLRQLIDIAVMLSVVRSSYGWDTIMERVMESTASATGAKFMLLALRRLEFIWPEAALKKELMEFLTQKGSAIPDTIWERESINLMGREITFIDTLLHPEQVSSEFEAFIDKGKKEERICGQIICRRHTSTILNDKLSPENILTIDEKTVPAWHPLGSHVQIAEGPIDFHLTAFFEWDEDNLYFQISTNKRTIQFGMHDEGDCVTLEFYPSGPASSAYYALTPNYNGTIHAIAGHRSAQEYVKLECAGSWTGGTGFLEIRGAVPWAIHDLKPKPGDKIGFEVTFQDRYNMTYRATTLVWNGAAADMNNAYGTMIFE